MDTLEWCISLLILLSLAIHAVDTTDASPTSANGPVAIMNMAAPKIETQIEDFAQIRFQ